MSHCQHQWRDRSQVLREVFSYDPERRTHDFFVCGRCLKIEEFAEGTEPSRDHVGEAIDHASKKDHPRAA